jgi:hypothetical protein
MASIGGGSDSKLSLNAAHLAPGAQLAPVFNPQELCSPHQWQVTSVFPSYSTAPISPGNPFRYEAMMFLTGPCCALLLKRHENPSGQFLKAVIDIEALAYQLVGSVGFTADPCASLANSVDTCTRVHSFYTNAIYEQLVGAAISKAF